MNTMKYFFIGVFALFLTISTTSLALGEGGLELIDFTVVQNLNKVDIKWSTSAVKTGGPYFCIEKSKDGKNFVKVVDMPATGQEASYADYFETDYQPYQGVSYYRVKQVDASGNFRYSQIVTLRIEGEARIEAFNAVAGTQSEETLKQMNVEDSEILLVIRDKNGDDHYTKAIVKTENNVETINIAAPMTAGTYQVVGASNEKLHSHNVLVK